MDIKDDSQNVCSRAHAKKLSQWRKQKSNSNRLLNCRSCNSLTPMTYEGPYICNSCKTGTPMLVGVKTVLNPCKACNKIFAGLGVYCSSCEESKKYYPLKKEKKDSSAFRELSFGEIARLKRLDKDNPPDGTCHWCRITLPPEANNSKKYCSRNHAKRAQKFRQEMATVIRETFNPNLIGRCPFPQKEAYSSKEDAMTVISHTERWYLVPYKCNCMLWHLGSNRLGSKANFEKGYPDSILEKTDAILNELSIERMRKELS